MSKPRIVIAVEGGVITSVISDTEGVEVMILDYDIEGTDEEDLTEDTLGNKVYLYGGTEMEYDPNWVGNEFRIREKS